MGPGTALTAVSIIMSGKASAYDRFAKSQVKPSRFLRGKATMGALGKADGGGTQHPLLGRGQDDGIDDVNDPV